MNNDSTFLSSENVPSPQAGPDGDVAPVGTSRRAFLSLTLAGCAAGCAALAGCGAPPSATGPKRNGDDWVVPGAGALTPGTSMQFIAAGEPVIVIGVEGGLRAFSGRCTHLGCAVEWHGDEKRFVCPCHASKFDTAGKVLNGPAEKPLPSYSVKKQGSDAVVTVKA